MDWDDCIGENKIREGKKDKNRAKSLLKTSQNRIRHVRESEIKNYNASTLFSDAYESLLQVCQAIISLKGYKVYNHVCITAFIKEILGKVAISSKFDRYRKVRNGINYYGEEIDKEFAEEAIPEIRRIILSLKNELLDEIQ